MGPWGILWHCVVKLAWRNSGRASIGGSHPASDISAQVCGEGRLLLGHTNGSKEVAPRALLQPNVRAIKLPPGSLYCLTGMARYDLRHALVHDGAAERVSITFRALK